MLRLLIVDDEPIIADGLHELISVSYPEKLEVLQVYSAEDAIQIFNRARVDILLLDIEMPGMDGISLMKQVQALWPYCRIIFLTGHDRFDYAYEAISGGVSAYLLKSEPDEKILATVDSCIDEIVRENDNEEFVRRIQDELQESRILMQRETVMNLLKGRASADRTVAKFESLNIPILPDEPCMLICGRVDALPGREEVAELQARIKILFYQYTRAIGRSFLLFENDDRYLYSILQPSITLNATRLFCEALERMQDACTSLTGLEISFIVDDQLVPVDRLSERFEELSHFLHYWLNGQLSPQLLQASYFTYRIDAGEMADLRSRSSQAKVLNELQNAVENADKAGYEEALFQVRKMLAGMDEHSPQRMEILGTVIARLSGFINKRRLGRHIPTALPASLCSLFYKSPEEVYEGLCAFGRAMFSTADEVDLSKDETFVQNIHRYIHQHLSQNITLLKLAEYMHYNSAYMSRLYKQITGTNLSDAVLEIKMAHAKEMLHQAPDMKIYEVAGKVGFEYPAYFTRVFKKHFGISPQEYRSRGA